MATPLARGYAYTGDARNRLSYAAVKKLAQAFGLPGDAFAQIAKGESGLYADVQQRDPGDSMVGYGLLQMTPNAWGKGSAAYQKMQQLGGIEAMKDPVKNMEMARFLYSAAGNKLTPWYGTRFLTNRAGEGTLGKVNRNAVPSALTTDEDADAGSDGGTTRTITTTTPGIDNKQARAQLVLSFLNQKSNDPLSFATKFRSLADVPGTTDTQTIETPGSPSPSSSRSAGGSGSSGVHGSKVLELIFNDGGKGYGIKDGNEVDGRSVFSSVWGGHANHVHVAAGPKTTVELGKLAQSMGLHVGENPHFGGVDPVHVAGSYHYKGEAIDVSGDKAKMAAFARRVAAYNRSKR